MRIDSAQTAMMAAAVASQQAQTHTAIQMEIVRNVAETQQAFVEMLREQGIGLQVDIRV